MGCFFTVQDLAILMQGKGAPIWHALVDLHSSTAVNLLSVLAVACGVGYIVRRLLLYYCSDRIGHDAVLRRLYGVRLPILVTVALAADPFLGGSIDRLSPLSLALVFPTLSLAVLASLVSLAHRRGGADPKYDGRRLVFVRLLVSGGLAAVGAWESTLGGAYAVMTAVLLPFSPVRRHLSVARSAGAWLFGFALAFAAERFVLGADLWLALQPTLPPPAWLVVFVLLGIVPLLLVLTFVSRMRKLIVAWCVVLSVCVVWSACRLITTGPSASQTFVRRCLEELNGRRLVLLDGFFDDMVRVYKPAEVRAVGARGVEDVEFLLNFFSQNEVVTNRALVVRDCYRLPEFAAAARELGLVWPLPSVATHHRARPAESGSVATGDEADAEVEIARSQVATVQSALDAMGSEYAKIPVAKRREAIEKARTDLRQGWENGVRGLELSAMLLSLDMMLGDVRAIESDAIMALLIDREDPAANAALGSLRLSQGQVDAAEGYLSKAVKGGGAMAMCDYARVLVMRGDFAGAERWARKAVGVKPDDAALREPLIAALVESRQFAVADQELKSMVRMARGAARDQAHRFSTEVKARMKALRESGDAAQSAGRTCTISE